MPSVALLPKSPRRVCLLIGGGLLLLLCAVAINGGLDRHPGDEWSTDGIRLPALPREFLAEKVILPLPPGPDGGASEPLDWRLRNVDRDNPHEVIKTVTRITGLKIPAEWEVIGLPAHMPLNTESLDASLPLNPTVRQTLVVYFKRSYDAGKIVRLDKHLGKFVIEYPWYTRVRLWFQRKLLPPP